MSTICLIAILSIAGCNLEQIYKQMCNTTMIEAEHPPRVLSPKVLEPFITNQTFEGHVPIRKVQDRTCLSRQSDKLIESKV